MMDPRDGLVLPAGGLGTWRMGEDASCETREVDAIHAALEAGVQLLDTAEMYANGGAERVVGRALKSSPVPRDRLVVVSKVLPSNASRRGTREACRRSLDRLGIATLDLYLLHWPGSHPLAGTIEAFEQLRDEGLIRHWGVSNFDVDAMRSLWSLDGGSRCVVNQVCWSLSQRGVEFDLKPWHDAHGVQTMAYSPLDEGRLVVDARLRQLAEDTGRDAGALALSWLARHTGTCAIPMTRSAERARTNADALANPLDDGTAARLDAIFPPPARAEPLHVI